MTPQELLGLFFCAKCVDEHGENPQSVSCYCECHDSVRDEARWPTVRALVLAALAGIPNENATGAPSGDA